MHMQASYKERKELEEEMQQTTANKPKLNHTAKVYAYKFAFICMYTSTLY